MTLQRTVDRSGVVRIRGWCGVARKRVTVVCGMEGDVITARREGQVYAEHARTGRIVQPERKVFAPMRVDKMIVECKIRGRLRAWLLEQHRHDVVTNADTTWLDQLAEWCWRRGMTRLSHAGAHRQFMHAMRVMAAQGVLPIASFRRMELWVAPDHNWVPPKKAERYTPPMSDIWAVIDRMGEPLGSFLAVLACSGMRRSDAVRIIGRWVEPVEPGLVRVTLESHKTASKVGARTVIVWGRGAEILSRLALASPDRVIWPIDTMPATTGAGRPAKHVWSKQRIDYQIGRVCEQYGVRRFTTHGMRRAVAKAMREKHGLETARIIMGHSSAVVTAAHYAEHDQTAAIQAARAAV